MKPENRQQSSDPEFEFPTVGKISGDIFNKVILPQLGHRDPRVLVPPQHGVDIGVVEVSPGVVMALTTDPVFIVPAYGWKRAAWFAIHILASDAVTSGLPPRYMTIDLNLPMSMTESQFIQMWNTMHEECVKLGISIVSGHTARYHGTDYPMVGGATVMSVGSKDSYVTPAMARPKDAIIVTKGAAIEATGLFAATFPEKIKAIFGDEFAKRAEEIFWQMSVVGEAMTAVSVGVRDRGVTSMHDATECGVFGGLVEVAQASGNGMRIEKEKILVSPEAEAICREFGMNPYTAISEGTLIITCVPESAGEVMRRIKKRGIPASVVGEITESDGSIIITENGIDKELEHPRIDPFWEAFDRAAQE